MSFRHPLRAARFAALGLVAPLALLAAPHAAYAIGTADGNIMIGTTTIPTSEFGVYGGTTIGTSYISTAAPTNGLLVQGNVGIGTASPGALLDVYGGAVRVTNIGSPTNGFIVTNSGTAALTLGQFSGAGIVQSAAALRLVSAAGRSISFEEPLNTQLAAIDTSGGTAGSLMVGGTFTGLGAFRVLGSNTNLPVAILAAPASQTADILDWTTGGTNGTVGTILGEINSSGNVGIGTTAPNAAAALDVTSTSKGFLPPRVTAAQEIAIGTNVSSGGLLVYNTTLNELDVYDSATGQWEAVGANAADAAGSTGQVQFNSGGDLAASANFFWDNTHNRLGIGTSTMASTFEVNGNESIGYVDTAAPSNGLIVKGNVGIGTTTPAAPLNVAATITNPTGTMIVNQLGETSVPGIVGRFTFSPSSNSVYPTSLDGITGTIDIPASNTHTVNSANGVYVAATNESTVVANGAITGINTEVWNTGTTGGMEGNFTFVDNVSGTSDYVIGGDFESEIDAGTATTIIGIDGYAWGNGGAVTDMYGAFIDPVISGVTVANRYGVYIDDGGGTATVDDFGLYQVATYQKNYFGGNVGIGTTAPQNKLDVNGAASVGYNVAAPSNGLIVSGQTGIGTAAPNAAALLDVYSTSKGFLPPRMTNAQEIAIGTNVSSGGLLVYNTTLNELDVYDSATGQWEAVGANAADAAGSTGQVQFNSGGDLAADSNFFWDNTNKRLGIGTATMASSFEVNGNESIGYVDTAAPSNGLLVKGNVGIGTTAPNSLLTLGNTATSGTLSFNGPNGTDTESVQIAYSQSLFGSNIDGLIFQNTVGSRFAGIKVVGANGYMQVNSGNFTVLTSGPNTGTAFTVSAGTGNLTNPELQINWDNINNISTYALSRNAHFTSAGTYSFDNNVGIGTSTIANKLDVNGAASIGYINTTAPSNGLLVSGNVGIGTTSPVATLDVNGYAHLAKNASQPIACDAAHDGSLALASTRRPCECVSSAWVDVVSGVACSW